MIEVLKSTVGLRTPIAAQGYHLLNPLASIEYVLASILVMNPTYQVGSTVDSAGVGIVTKSHSGAELVKLKAGLMAVLNGSLTIKSYKEAYAAANNISSIASAFVNTRDLTSHILEQGASGIGLQLKLALDEMAGGASFNKVTLRAILKKIKKGGASNILTHEDLITLTRRSVGASAESEGDQYADFKKLTSANDCTLTQLTALIKYYLGLANTPANSHLFQLAETLRTVALVQDFENGTFASAAKNLQSAVPLPSLEVLNNTQLTEFMQSNVAYAGLVTAYSMDLPLALLRLITDMVLNSPELNKFFLIEQDDLKQRLEKLESWKVVNSWPVHRIYSALAEGWSMSMQTPLHTVHSQGVLSDLYDILKASYNQFSSVRKTQLEGGSLDATQQGFDKMTAVGPAPSRQMLEKLHSEILNLYFLLEPHCVGNLHLGTLGQHRNGITLSKKSINVKMIADSLEDVVIGKGIFFRHHSDNNPFSLMNKLVLSEKILTTTLTNPTYIGKGDKASKIASDLYVNSVEGMIGDAVRISLPTTRSIDDSLFSSMATRLLRIKPVANLELIDPHTQVFVIPDAAGFANLLGISVDRVLDIFSHPVSKRLFNRSKDPNQKLDIKLLKSTAPMFAINDSFVDEARGVFTPAPDLKDTIEEMVIFDSAAFTVISNSNSVIDPSNQGVIIKSNPGFNVTLISAADVHTLKWGSYFEDEYGIHASELINSIYFQ